MAADTSTTILSVCKEASFGLLAALAAFTDLRYTGETLSHNKNTIKSNEIRPTRGVKNLIQVGVSAGGDVQFELALRNNLDFWAAALGQAAWSTFTFTDTASVETASNTIEFQTGFSGLVACGYLLVEGFTNPANNGIKRVISTNGSDSVTFADGSFVADDAGEVTISRTTIINGTYQDSFTFERAILTDGGRAYQNYTGMTCGGASLKLGSMEHITGAFSFLGSTGAPLNRSLARAGETAASGTLTLSGNAVANETVTVAGVVYTWKASPTTNANEVKVGATASISIDNLIAAINGGTGSGTLYGSATVAHTRVTAAAGSGDTMVVTALLTNYTGAAGNSLATTEAMTNGSWGAATLTGGISANAHTQPSSEDCVNATNNLVLIHADTTVLSDPAKSLSLTINNNLRGKDKMGQLGAFEIGQGQFEATGTLEVYYEDNALWTKIVNHEDISLSFLLTDEDGNSFGITFPRVKMADGNPNAQGNNADHMLTINFTALEDPVTGAVMQIDTFAA